jgi:hypothetical protein
LPGDPGDFSAETLENHPDSYLPNDPAVFGGGRTILLTILPARV